MSNTSRPGLLKLTGAFAVVALLGVGAEAFAQALPNPYRTVDGWAKLPNGRQMGAVGGVTMDPDGNHLWAVIRCDATAPERFGNECLDSDLDPVVKFNMEGQAVRSFGGWDVHLAPRDRCRPERQRLGGRTR